MGSAYKNKGMEVVYVLHLRQPLIYVWKGVQPLLDGVNFYLPSPNEVTNTALDLSNDEMEVSQPASSVTAFKQSHRVLNSLFF
jgi:hypothetical protein